jgi:hypothetical protein
VATKHLSTFYDGLKEDIVDEITNFFVQVHVMMRAISAASVPDLNRTYYADDSKFIELITVFQSQLQKKRAGIDNHSKRLNTGLHQFMVVGDTVSQLRSELEGKVYFLILSKANLPDSYPI